MVFPNVRPWVEKPDQFLRLWINTGEVGTLLTVAEMAGKGQILRLLRATVLPGKNVFDVERPAWLITLVHFAVLAAVSCPCLHKFPGLGVHYGLRESTRRERAFNCISATKSISSM